MSVPALTFKASRCLARKRVIPVRAPAQSDQIVIFDSRHNSDEGDSAFLNLCETTAFDIPPLLIVHMPAGVHKGSCVIVLTGRE